MSERGVPVGAGRPVGNEMLAQRFEEVANLLEAQAANPFRVRAYRRAADTLRGLPRPARAILTERGLAGLTELPGIGAALARAIEQLLATGSYPLLEQLRGGGGCVAAFATVPGIGPELARRIHQHLDIDTLYDLEIAANDGRLATVPGMGPARVQAVRESLAGRFRRGRAAPESSRRPAAADVPPVAELLDVDREYRSRDRAGTLPRIAPKRFNASGEAWLSIMHTARGPRHYTVLHSNTARAHELGTTRDWVVVYRDDHEGDGQWTVVTARGGDLRGRRVVRGREAECRQYHAAGDRPTVVAGARDDAGSEA